MASILEFATETDWFAIDSRGQMALFVSSFGPVPVAVAWNVEWSSTISARILSLPATTSITSHYAGLGRANLTDLACRGVFGFVWSDYDGPYLKVVSPCIPLVFDAFAADHDFLAVPVLPTIRFDLAMQVAQLDVAQWEPYVQNPATQQRNAPEPRLGEEPN